MFKRHPVLGYYISDRGIVMKSRGCGEKKLMVSSAGYQTFSFNGKTQLVHRLVIETFIGTIPNGMQVNHINGIKTDNRLENLEVVTPQENMRHAVATGLKTGKAGSENSMAKLTDDEYYSVICQIAAGASNQEIADQYGLHSRYVSLIRGKKRLKKMWDKYESIYGTAIVPLSGGNSHLSFEQRMTLLDDLETMSNAEVALKYCLDPSTVSKIRHKHQWRQLWQIKEQNVQRLAQA